MLPSSLVPEDHPIYQPGVTVSIGLEKTTRLSAVFSRYCEFANSYVINQKLNVDPADLEFSHCSALAPSDTAETAALMKNDRIKVHRVQLKERRAIAENTRAQRDSDREYFSQMRNLLPDKTPAQLKCDVVFHCRGKITDENGYKQEVLTTYVRGHSALLSKRCKWLAKQIEVAKGDLLLGDDLEEDIVFEANNNGAFPIPDNDDGDIRAGARRIENEEYDQRANAVEDDEDDERDIALHKIQDVSADESGSNPNAVPIDGGNDRDRSPGIPYVGGNFPDILRVVLSHPPEAVKLLLEYCYSNRVIPLGQMAFIESYKPVDSNTVDPLLADLLGPVSPFYNPRGLRSPNSGMPTVSLSVALAGIQLAEEAKIPRLSLMCEIAASQVVTANTVLEALALCEQQHKATGNRLTHLRKAVMLHHILGRGRKGVNDLSNMASFKRTLKEKSDVVVPSLMMGVMETVKCVLGEKDDPDLDIEHCHNRKRSSNMYLKT